MKIVFAIVVVALAIAVNGAIARPATAGTRSAVWPEGTAEPGKAAAADPSPSCLSAHRIASSLTPQIRSSTILRNRRSLSRHDNIRSRCPGPLLLVSRAHRARSLRRSRNGSRCASSGDL